MKSKIIEVLAPVDGTIKDMKDVKDETFSTNMLGQGVAIIPKSPYIYSPIKGIVKTAFPTGHAYGIKSKSGPSLLIHIGIDTVELKGDGFLRFVMQEDRVKPKTKLTKVDWEKIIANKKGTDVIIIATDDSMEGYKLEIQVKKDQEVKTGDLLFTIIPTE